MHPAKVGKVSNLPDRPVSFSPHNAMKWGQCKCTKDLIPFKGLDVKIGAKSDHNIGATVSFTPHNPMKWGQCTKDLIPFKGLDVIIGAKSDQNPRATVKPLIQCIAMQTFLSCSSISRLTKKTS